MKTKYSLLSSLVLQIFIDNFLFTISIGDIRENIPQLCVLRSMSGLFYRYSIESRRRISKILPKSILIET